MYDYPFVTTTYDFENGVYARDGISKKIKNVLVKIFR